MIIDQDSWIQNSEINKFYQVEEESQQKDNLFIENGKLLVCLSIIFDRKDYLHLVERIYLYEQFLYLIKNPFCLKDSI